MANSNNPPSRGKGKGGNFETRPNPFQKVTKSSEHAPGFGDNAFLGQALDRVLSAGNAVILGHTRDGGAVVITILEGDTRHRTYCANGDELDQAIAAMMETYGPDQ